VADLRAAVCDTHALLFHATGDRRLGRRAAAILAACEAQRTIVYVPSVVLWEIALLAWRGRVNLRRPLEAFADDLFSNPAYQPLDLTVEQIALADARRPNDDPFDALIVAAARVLDLPLVTRDQAIVESKIVRTVW
jgi:PIN domain nuclease of toxin-antitoxin system